MSYKKCKICKRVTNHKEVRTESKTFAFPMGSVELDVFFICPHCDTGISGDVTTVSNLGKIESSFTKNFG